MAKKDKASKPTRDALETTQSAEISWLSNQWQEHPVVGLTPRRLHQLMTEAEQGNLTAQADLFCDMEERDGHIYSEMDKRKRGVASMPWGVNPPRNASESERKIAEELAEWLDDVPDLESAFIDALDGIGHGYSGQEIQWQQQGNLWLPKAFHFQPARNFMTAYNQPNVLRLNDGIPEGADFWPYGWIIHHHKAKSGYISRSGLHRVLAWPFLFKNYGVRDVMEFLEIYGLPIRLGKYPSGATDQEKMTLQRAVMMIGRNAGGIIPQGMAIDFESAANGDTDNHMALINWCEKVQSKVIVGGTLLSQADGKTSTNAQSSTHEVQFEVLKKSDAKQLARSINDTLIKYLMELNYPNITPDRYPKFYFDVSDTEDLTVFAEAVPKLVEVGMKIPLAWAHEKLGIPKPADDSVPILKIQSAPSLAANHFQYAGQAQLAALNQNLPALVDAPDAVTQRHAQALRGQLLIESEQQQLDNADLQAQAEQLLPQIIARLSRENDIDAALAALSQLYPESDLTGLQDKLEQLIFASDALGRVIANEGRKGG